MKSTLKLVLLYFAYQLLASAIMFGISQIHPISMTTQLGWTLLLSGTIMTTHLIVFDHVQLNNLLRPIASNILVYSIVCLFGAILCSNALNELMTLPNWLEKDFMAMSHNILGIMSIALMAPWIEELLFRGAILQSLRNSGYTPQRAIILSALAFGLIHINPAQVVFAFLIGLVLGWITWKTNSLYPAIIGHALNNSLGVAQMAICNTETMLPPHTPHATVILLSIAVIGLAITLFAGHRIQIHTLQKTEK